MDDDRDDYYLEGDWRPEPGPSVGQAVLGAVIYVLALVLLGLALVWGPRK